MDIVYDKLAKEYEKEERTLMQWAEAVDRQGHKEMAVRTREAAERKGVIAQRYETLAKKERGETV